MTANPDNGAGRETVERPEGRTPALMEYFFRNTTVAILVVFACMFAGYFALTGMIKEDFPDLKIPQATVVTEWVGADPKTIEQQVTTKIEEKIKGLDGLKSLRSASFDSFSVIIVKFNADANLTESHRLLREAVQDAVPKLPKAAKRPKITKATVNLAPVVTFSLHGDVGPGLLGSTAKKLKDRLLRLRGVSEVDIGGRRKEVVEIRLINSRLIALRVSSSDVVEAFRAASADVPWERIDNKDLATAARLEGRFRSVRDLQNMPVARMGERRVLLREVADVRRDVERRRTIARMSYRGGEFRPCVTVDVKKSPGADTVTLIEQAKRAVKDFSLTPAWPYGLGYKVTTDQSARIWGNLMNVFTNGWQAMLCVFVVLFFALTWREAIIAGLSIPITFLGALGVLWAIGYTLNQMVIIGMVIGLGLLVDDFILMMEGMHDNLSKGLDISGAQSATLKQYGVASLAGSLTTIVVFIPLMCIGGLDGKFVRLIPVTAAICLCFSYVISLIADLPLSRYLLRRPRAGRKPGPADRITEWTQERFGRWLRAYALRSKFVASLWVLCAFATLVLAVWGSSLLPVMLYPKTDGRDLGITIRMRPETVLEDADRLVLRVGEILRKKSYIQSIIAYTGRMSPMSRSSLADALIPEKQPYYVSFSCHLTPLRARKGRMGFTYAPGLRRELQAALNRNAPGAELNFRIDTGGSCPDDPVQIEVRGEDIGELRALSDRVKAMLRAVPGAVDVRDNLGAPRLDVVFKPIREGLDFFNITAEDMATQVRYATANDKIGEFPSAGAEEDLEVRLSYAWPSRGGKVGGPRDWMELALLVVFNPDRRTAPLNSVMTYKEGVAPISITHSGGRRAVVVSCQTRKRTPGDVFADMKTALEKDRKGRLWLAGYEWAFRGEAESSAETYGSSAKAVLIAVLLVFAVLAVQFNSFLPPILIMVALPLSLVGVCGGFFLVGMPFSFVAMVGIISLVGIAVNNAIVLVETTRGFREEGRSSLDSIVMGASQRLRPIAVTTVTTVVGLTPLALSDPMWTPLCLAIIFGLGASTVASLVIIPCLYRLASREESSEP